MKNTKFILKLTNAPLMWLNWKESKKEILKTLKGQSGIYMFLCNSTNKCCIGSSLDLRRRMWSYYSPFVRKREDRLIHRAIEKYGEEDFSLIILEFCPEDAVILLKQEQLALDLWKPQYNVRVIAGAPGGYIHTDETKALMSELKKGDNNPFFGKSHTEEVKELLKELNIGINHPNYGKKRSVETVNKIITSSSYRAKPVYCYTWEDKSYVTTYSSVNKMAINLNLVRGTIQYCIKNQTALKTSKGKYLVSYSLLSF
ncbi:unnamed protein product [Absidia cylindrospora]